MPYARPPFFLHAFGFDSYQISRNEGISGAPSTPTQALHYCLNECPLEHHDLYGPVNRFYLTCRVMCTPSDRILLTPSVRQQLDYAESFYNATTAAAIADVVSVARAQTAALLPACYKASQGAVV